MLREVSGVVASRNNPGVLWVHNDSGDAARVFALDTKGRHLATFTLAGHRFVDCEDIALGPGPLRGVDYLYVGDIGDNHHTRRGLIVYRFAEPIVRTSESGVSKAVAAVDRIKLAYPDGPHDAESLLCDPLSGDLYIITKDDAGNRVYRAAAAEVEQSALQQSQVALRYCGSMNWPMLASKLLGAVAADVSADGTQILVKSYNGIFWYHRKPGDDLAKSLVDGRRAHSLPCARERQGEAIGFDANDQGYFTLSEGHKQPLYYFQRMTGETSAQPRILVAAGSAWHVLRDQVGLTGDADGKHAEDFAVEDALSAPLNGEPAMASPVEGPAVAQLPLPCTTVMYVQQFKLASAAELRAAWLKMVSRFDATVYLNGRKVLEFAAMANTPDAWRSASATLIVPPETWVRQPVDPGLLVRGVNTLVVEVRRPMTDDPATAPFDLELSALPGKSVPEPTAWAMLVVVAVLLLGGYFWVTRRRAVQIRRRGPLVTPELVKSGKAAGGC